jgi:hypothetical protein
MIEQEKAKMLAEILRVEVQDGWYYVADLTTMDGNGWVTEKEFLEIIQDCVLTLPKDLV